ncbi:hypothetical protein RRG08_026231 [Elysia crispata]|uniref:Uncharacterized protein n=1 Tax=Elysia crispata TaxID=231223 RepID=A0AAE0ZAS6_9GAST|nr:hypothetical protein RRG08_026231 [Elysia crispata]
MRTKNRLKCLHQLSEQRMNACSRELNDRPRAAIARLHFISFVQSRESTGHYFGVQIEDKVPMVAVGNLLQARVSTIHKTYQESWVELGSNYSAGMRSQGQHPCYNPPAWHI